MSTAIPAFDPLKPVGPCEGCGKLTKRRSSKLRDNFYRCPACCLRALANFMEAPEPGDTLADISSGEQTGAWLRDIADGKKP